MLRKLAMKYVYNTGSGSKSKSCLYVALKRRLAGVTTEY